MSVQDEWDAATDHQFCRELAAGTLPLDKMRWYLVQDYKFIEQFVRLLATSIAHAPTLADGVPSAQFLGLVTSTENTYFQRCFEALEITQADQEAPAAPATEDFLALMAEARMSNRYEQMLAVLVVAEWSYLTWAERYEDYDPKLPFWFAEWIDLHCGSGFAGVVEHLRSQLDNIWDSLSDQQQRSASSMFQRAVACERSFFDAAYSSH
ncbi:MAG: TenA family protein [Pseudomonadota bacterium]